MKRFVLTLSLVLLLAAPALAQDSVKWFPDFDEALKLAKKRGSLIFITMLIDEEADNDAQWAAFQEPAFVKVSEHFICIYCCPQAGHGTTRVEENGKQVVRCRKAPTIACQNHIRNWERVLANYDKNKDSRGDVRIPYSFVIDADGNVLEEVASGSADGGFAAVGADQCVSIMERLLKKYGKGLTTTEYDTLLATLEDARTAERAGDHPKALRLATEVMDKGGKTHLADDAKAIAEEAAKVANAAIEEAKGKAAEDPAGAVIALEKLADEYSGTSVEKDAQAAVRSLKKDPRVKKVLSQIEQRKAAEEDFAAVEEYVADEEWSKALKLLDRIARKYKGTPFAERANKRAEEIRSDPDIAAKALQQEADKVARGWFSMGVSYAKNGMKDKAKAQFEKIIAKYPGTSWSEKAQAELDKLK